MYGSTNIGKRRRKGTKEGIAVRDSQSANEKHRRPVFIRVMKSGTYRRC